jgi:hypothetical protein
MVALATIGCAPTSHVCVDARCCAYPRPMPPPSPEVVTPPEVAASAEGAGFTIHSCQVATGASLFGDYEYDLVHTGSHGGFRELAQFQRRHSPSLREIGVESSAIGDCGCAEDDRKAYCLDLAVVDPAHAARLPAELARWIAADGLAAVAMRFSLVLFAPTPERCSRADPECGPQPGEPGCLGEKGHRFESHRRRKPVRTPSRFPENRCTHDGDCWIDGCGSLCRSRRERPTVAICVNVTLEAFCGCVEGSCEWFR